MMMMINVLYSFLPIFVIGDGLINFKMLMVECKQSPQPTIAMAADVLFDIIDRGGDRIFIKSPRLLVALLLRDDRGLLIGPPQ